jgi:hypothetical protein
MAVSVRSAHPTSLQLVAVRNAHPKYIKLIFANNKGELNESNYQW